MSGIKTKLGAGATVAALGGLAAYAVGSSDQPAATSAAATQPVQVRTETIRRTVHVVRHEKPRHRRAERHAAPMSAAPAPVPVGAAAAVAPRPVPARVVSAPAPARHVTTRSSGSGSGSGEHEREHEVEHEGGDD